MKTIQCYIEDYIKTTEKWLGFNDKTLDLVLAKSNIVVDKKLMDLEFIMIQLGYVCICLQTLDASLDILIEKHKLAKVDFGMPMCYRNKRLYDHKIISESVYNAIVDLDQAGSYLTNYFYAPIAKANYLNVVAKKPLFKDYDLIIRLANSVWTLGNKLNDIITEFILTKIPKKKDQH